MAPNFVAKTLQKFSAEMLIIIFPINLIKIFFRCLEFGTTSNAYPKSFISLRSKRLILGREIK